MGAERLPRPEPPDLSGLSEEDRREVLEESGVSEEVAGGGRYWTASRLADVPEVFPRWQRRRGLIGKFYSPDSQTVSYQLKPKKPRHKGPKYETPARTVNILDVHPIMRAALKDISIPLWITEGLKKADSLTSRGRLALALAGVWNWFLKGGAPLPCWQYVHLKGRLVYVAFDSDCRTKEGVQLALARLVAFLESRGARVLVVNIPHRGDGKTGVDDYLAGGGTPEELEQDARPFKPVNVGTERLKEDSDLQGRTGYLWHRWSKRERRTRGDYTDRSIERAMIRKAEQRGKCVKDGVRVEIGHRELSEDAGVSSVAPSRSIPRLVEAGHVRVDNKSRERHKRGAFVLLVSPEEGARYCRHKGRKGQPERKEKREKVSPVSGFSPLANEEYDPGDYSTARPPDEVPELRHPTIRFSQEKDKRGNPVKVGEYVSRPGKERGAIVEYLVGTGGSASIAELMVRFSGPRTRTRDFKRIKLSYLRGYRLDRGQRFKTGPPVVEVDGDTVRLAEGWREALQCQREITGEVDVSTKVPARDRVTDEIVWETKLIKGDETRQREKHARQREAFRTLDKRPADEFTEAPPMDDMREPWPHHPKACDCKECVKRWGRIIGPHSEDCRCATCAAPRREEQARRVARLRIGRRHAPDRPDLAAVVPLRYREAEPESHPATVAGSQTAPVAVLPEPEPHSPFCDCPSCAYLEPSYARPWGGA